MQKAGFLTSRLISSSPISEISSLKQATVTVLIHNFPKTGGFLTRRKLFELEHSKTRNMYTCTSNLAGWMHNDFVALQNVLQIVKSIQFLYTNVCQ